MALAYEVGIPVVGRGSGTGLSGGAISPPGGIQVAFTRMNQVLEVDTENRHAVVEPGVINLDLDTHVRKFGFRYAPDPSSQRACSLGGNIAENAGGPHCLAYGTTTNHVLGMEVVLEDGSVIHLGSLARETPGYDLRGVFTGSEEAPSESPPGSLSASCRCPRRSRPSWAFSPTSTRPAPRFPP